MLAKQWIEYSVCGSEHEVAKESATCKLRHFATVADDEQGQQGWWRLETRSEGAEDAEPDRAGYIYGLRSEGPDYRQTRFRKCLDSVCPLENRVFYVQSLSVPDLWAVVSSAECCASPEDSDPWPISPDRVLQYILFPTLDYLQLHTP